MQFNSFSFLIFFLVTLGTYCCCNYRWQNRLLLVASYVFYAAWDYRFLSILMTSTIIAFFSCSKISVSSSQKVRKYWLLVSVVSSLGILGVFKYFNFFIESLKVLFPWFGLGDFPVVLNIVLPVGISFFTFQTLSYTIDVYRSKIEPASSFLNFALYVSFFPTILAGPIERAKNLLPQINSERKISPLLFKTSVFLILYGLFEKVVVADNLTVIVDNVYQGNNKNGLNVLVATYAFAIQIFADFDGYSNIAKGIAGIMGFQLMTNFNAPYFSHNPSDFWNRWHISLSTWLRDYLYIPLGGNRLGAVLTVRNLLLTMILAGLWHGAGWMFLFWGGFHGVLLAIYFLCQNHISLLPLLFRRVLFFHLICFGWMIFRSDSLAQLLTLLNSLVWNFYISFDVEQVLLIKKFLFYSVIPISYQYLQYTSNKFTPIFEWPLFVRAGSYATLFYMIVIFGFNNAQSFIYFKF